jgi:hypothetical protein
MEARSIPGAAKPTNTRPMGLPSSSGSAPVTPVTDSARLASPRSSAPLAIASATSACTAVHAASSSGGTPTKPGLGGLGIGDEPARKHRRRSDSSGQAIRQNPVRAGFNRDQSKRRVRRQPDQPFGKRFYVLEPIGRGQLKTDGL